MSKEKAIKVNEQILEGIWIDVARATRWRVNQVSESSILAVALIKEGEELGGELLEVWDE